FTGRPVNAVVEEARRVKMRDAREAFRDGLITLEQLGQQLQAAGIEAPVITAVVDFEQNKRLGDERSKADQASAAAAAPTLREHRDAAVAAFRAGTIDEHALLSNLLAIGVQPSQAEAIVSTEVQRRDEGAASSEQTDTEREADQNEKLREEAVIFGLRSGLV